MKTITISPDKSSIKEILNMAKKEPLLVKIKEGDSSFFISLADDFGTEIELLSKNHRFLSMLDKLKQEKETIPLADVEKSLR